MLVCCPDTAIRMERATVGVSPPKLSSEAATLSFCLAQNTPQNPGMLESFQLAIKSAYLHLHHRPRYHHRFLILFNFPTNHSQPPASFAAAYSCSGAFADQKKRTTHTHTASCLRYQTIPVTQISGSFPGGSDTRPSTKIIVHRSDGKRQ